MPFKHLCLAVLGVLIGASARAADRPNIVVFLTDDLGFRDCSVHGATDVRTPNMRRLAKDGMTFTHAFVASPSCAPSRAAMLTGLMPARNGAEANHSLPRKVGAGSPRPYLPAYLQECGYEVVAFGKVAHYKSADHYGFDRHDERHYNAEFVAKYLAGRKTDKPLCLFVGTHDPHVPWPEIDGYDPAKVKLPPTHVDTPQTRDFRARYYTAVTRADTLLGEVYDLARKHLGPKNTLFLYTSDHGAQWPFGKWNLYDAGIRVPLLAVWPGVIEPGTKSEAMVSWIDLLPTFVELGGGDPPKDIDGRSFAKVLLGKTKKHRDRIFTTHSGDGRMNVYPIRSVRTRDFKYILNPHPNYSHTTHIDQARDRDGLKYWRPWEAKAKTDPKAAAIVKRYHERPREELYDLRADPFETDNLAADPKHAETLKKLRAEVKAWMKRQGDTGKVFNQPRLLPGRGPEGKR